MQMELKRIMITETSDQQVIVLKEKGGVREFPILIGIYEATAIDRSVKDIETPRPLTHDLLSSVMRNMGGRLERIVVNDLRDSTFFAKLMISRNGENIEVDSRPSDAIALAVHEKAPIFVDEEVVEAVCNWGVV